MEQQVEALKQNAELRAFNTVVELIRQREIVPGQRLFEPDLSKRLSMSRTPLRTALSRLVAEGILVKERGRKGYLLPALSSEDMRQISTAAPPWKGPPRRGWRMPARRST